jgi:hypothetical protein
MSTDYSGLTPDEADDLMVGKISTIIFEELAASRRMTPEEWEHRDIFQWSDSVAGAIYCTMQNRRMGAP